MIPANMPSSTASASPDNGQPPRLLDQLVDAAQRHGHAHDAAELMADWCRRYILFHGKRHPRPDVRTRH